MNLNNWRNWGTNLSIRLGFRDQYAHAFVEQDYFIEDTTEEVSLAPTFFEWRIGKNWYKPWKWGGGKYGGGGNSGKADIEKARREATEKAKAEAAKVAEKHQAAYAKQQEEINAMKAAQEARKGRATYGASQLAIGPGAQDRVGKMKRDKDKRKVGTQQTRKVRDKQLIAQGPATGGGAYGGAPVV